MKDIYTHLNRLLLKLNLTEHEAKLLTAAFACPGLSARQLGKQSRLSKMSTYRALESLVSKNYISESQDPGTGRRQLTPTPLTEIAKQVDRKCADLKRFAFELEEVGGLLKYPPHQGREMDIAKYYGDEAREAYFDLLFEKWNLVIGIGELECFVNTIRNSQDEQKWITKRVKLGRKARGVFTGTSELTHSFINENKRCLRTSVHKPNVMKGRFVYIFPETNKSIIIKNPEYKDDFEILSLTSADVSHLYTNLIDHHFAA